MVVTNIQADLEVAMIALALASLAILCWRALAAEHQARLLLRDILTDDEQRQLAADGYLETHSPNVPQRVYRIPYNPG